MNYQVVLVTAVCLAGLIAGYCYIRGKKLLSFWKVNTDRKIVKGIWLCISLLFGFLGMNVFSFPSLVLLHLLWAFVVCDLLYLLWKKQEILFRGGILPVFLTMLVLGYGYFNMNHIVEKEYTVYTGKELQREYTAAMISDLHMGTTMNLEKLERICREIEAQKPDLLLLCGDIVDESSSYENMAGAMKLLADVSTTYGTFYVYGNHDTASYGYHPDFTAEQLNREMEQAGIHILLDQVVPIAEDLLLVGRNDRSSEYRMGRVSTEELLQGADRKQFLLLMDHQPVELKENAAAGVDLQVSGHTHGGQIWPVGWISDLLGFGELNYGWKQTGDFQVIVSSGIAGWGYPVRTGHHSEYLMIHISQKGE